VTCPRPRTYSIIKACMSGWVLLRPSHSSNSFVDWPKAAVRPVSGHRAICLQVSLAVSQLGHNLLRPSW
jgi:hypothetical protein